MADLIDLVAHRLSCCSISRYQAYRFSADGSIRSTILIEADGDVAAKRHASTLIDGRRLELWAGARFISHILTHDGPIATSIRLVND